MFKAIAILASLVSIAAFIPARLCSGRSASLKRGFEGAPSVLPPVGSFGPLGLAKNIDQDNFDQHRTPSISAEFERFITKSREILGIDDAQELEANSVRLAFALQAMEKAMEKDKELSVLRIAMEKDKEKDMALLRREFLEREAYRKSQLMHLTQRYVKSVFERMQTFVTGTIRSLLEKLFRDVIACYQRPDSELSKLKDYLRRSNKEIKRPSMSDVNRLLKDDKVREAFWADIGLDPSLESPDYESDEILYGSLSDSIHHPTWNVVYIPSSFPMEKQVFYEKVGHRYKLKVEVLDVNLVAAGKG